MNDVISEMGSNDPHDREENDQKSHPRIKRRRIPSPGFIGSRDVEELKSSKAREASAATLAWKEEAVAVSLNLPPISLEQCHVCDADAE